MKNKPNIKKAAYAARRKVSQSSPKFLTVLGVVGFSVTVILAVKATPKAMVLLEEAKTAKAEELDITEENVDLTPVEKIRAVWKPFTPVAALGIASAGCILGANSITAKRTAALTTVAQLSKEALREYREKAIEVVGEKKDKMIRDKVAEDKVKKNPVEKQQVLITNKGNTLCYDQFSGRYFKGDVDVINRAVNEINYCLLNEMYAPLNMFYEKIGLECNKVGDLMGWNIDRDGQIELYLSAQLTKDGEPCLVLDFDHVPDYEFSKLTY